MLRLIMQYDPVMASCTLLVEDAWEVPVHHVSTVDDQVAHSPDSAAISSIGTIM